MKKDNAGVVFEDVAIELGGQILFSGLSQTVHTGEKVLIAGKSGSGKSSLLKAMLGFIRLQNGSIYIDGEKLNQESVWQIRKKIAYVPQEPIFQPLSLEKSLKAPFSYHANSNLKWNERDFDELLERFGLPKSSKHKNTEDLSGGEKQRAAIISALLLKRQYILLDEPTSALDRNSCLAFKEMISSLADVTIFLVSHDEKNQQIAGRKIDITNFAKGCENG